MCSNHMACQEDKTFSKLAKHGDGSSNPNSCLYNHEGFWYPGLFINGVVKAQELRLFPRDILLCSSPKSGTTWLKALAFSIVSRTRFGPGSHDHPLLTTIPHFLIPSIEITKSRDPEEPPLFSTHMPYSALPDSSSGYKVVYICRNPKDVFVSLWFFLQKVESFVPLDKLFDLFCQGISGYGPYWDHVLGYYKASLDHPERVLFLKYEDMMEDTGSYVRRLARFMGYPFSEEEERDNIPTRIMEMCSFRSLSNLDVNKADKFSTLGTAKILHSSFYRKGKVGDWRNYLTHDMAVRLDDIFSDKLGSFGLTL